MKGTRILLIDDETDFTETLAERLEMRGFKTMLASDGETGIKLVSEHEMDVVVLDLKMPGLNGLDTLKRIKASHPDLPVILLTGQGSTDDGQEGKALGAFDYLMKPLKIDDLIEKINCAMHQ